MVFVNKGLSGIISISVLVLMLLYPLTVVIILLAFLNNWFGGSRVVYVCTIFATLVVGVLDAWKAAFSFALETAVLINSIFPLYDIGMGWLLPATAGFVLGLVLKTAIGKKG